MATSGIKTRTKEISIAVLRECVSYDCATGTFTWKHRPPEHFPTSRACNIWNSRFAGRVAGTRHPLTRRALLTIFGVRYQAARVAWAFVHDCWPDEIDHINQICDDDRIVNLRDVTSQQNHRNMPLREDNTYGHTGVVWDAARNLWMARIGRKYLGRFGSLSAALRTRKKAESRFGYHANHGAPRGALRDGHV